MSHTAYRVLKAYFSVGAKIEKRARKMSFRLQERSGFCFSEDVTIVNSWVAVSEAAFVGTELKCGLSITLYTKSSDLNTN